MLKRGRHVLIFLLLFIITMMMVSLILNPLLKTRAGIQRYLLNITPIGTSIEDIIHKAADNTNWTIRSRDAGVALHPTRLNPTRGVADDPRFPVVGEQSVEVHLGTYRHITRVDVTAFFTFNEYGKLMEIFVIKEYDLI